MIWLNRDMRWHGSPLGKRGRTQTFSDAAIQFCLTIKCLFNLALRQTMGMVQSLLSLAELGGRHRTTDSTVCRRQKSLPVAIPCRPTTAGLHLLIDSTGIKMQGAGEWKTKTRCGVLPPVAQSALGH